MKLSRKIISAVSAAAVFVSMAIPAFATNSYTTTVTYDIGTGKANFVTNGNATAGKEVTHIVYEKQQSDQKIDGTTIYYVDQTTAESDGSFRFSYSVVSGKAAKTAVSVVGTDGEAIVNTAENNNIEGYSKVTVTNSDGLELTFSQGESNTVTGNDALFSVYVKKNENVNISATDGKFLYNGTEQIGTYAVKYSENEVNVTISKVTESTDTKWDTWGDGVNRDESVPEYNQVMTGDNTVAEKAGAVENATKPEGMTGDLKEGSKSATLMSKINATIFGSAKASDSSAEYGIIFIPSEVSELSELSAETEGAYILPALEYSDNGAWGVCVVDQTGNAIETYTARTYIKIHGKYEYGTNLLKPDTSSIASLSLDDDIAVSAIAGPVADDTEIDVPVDNEKVKAGEDAKNGEQAEETPDENTSEEDTSDENAEDGEPADTEVTEEVPAESETPEAEPEVPDAE